MAKEKYNGLLTRRTAVECAPLLETSTKIKVKTNVTNGDWEEVDGGSLKSSISETVF